MSIAEAEVLKDGRRSRREAMEAKRGSKRPSRSGRPAGTSQPVHHLGRAGFSAMLDGVVESARSRPTVGEMLDTVLTLGGQLPRERGVAALDALDRCGLEVLAEGAAAGRPADMTGWSEPGSVFTSVVGITSHGRLVVSVPGRRTFPPEAQEYGVVAWVPWTAEDLERFRERRDALLTREAAEVAECRDHLRGLPSGEVVALVGDLRRAVSLVPPTQFYRGRTVLSNLRDEDNLTGKSLPPGHPDCIFTALLRLPVEDWSDDDVVTVCSLWVLYVSGGPNRMESSNGHHLDLERVWTNLRSVRDVYAAATLAVDLPDLPAERPGLPEVLRVAEQLSAARTQLIEGRALSYYINATTRSKLERALPPATPGTAPERAVVGALAAVVPNATAATTLDDVVRAVRTEPQWLCRPDEAGTIGLERVIWGTVAAAVDAFDADFALSRGLRSLPRLVRALRDRDFREIVSWELPEFYCCVVPSRRAIAFHDGDRIAAADAAWAMSARMAYNTWHVMPGNLPKNDDVDARDFLAPHVLPDIADFSDLHHRGHVLNSVTYSARSPEKVLVDGHVFKSLTDLRVLRCSGEPFVLPDLVPVARIARFLADTVTVAAELAAAGHEPVVRAFDHEWHRATIVDGVAPR